MVAVMVMATQAAVFVSASDSIVGITSSSAHSGGMAESIVGNASCSKHRGAATANASVRWWRGCVCRHGVPVRGLLA